MGGRERLKEMRMRLYEIAGNQCELCGSNQGLSIHHIFPKSDPAHCRDKFWNMIVLCHKCHRHYKREDKGALIKLHVKHIKDYVQKWNLKVNKDWTEIVSK